MALFPDKKRSEDSYWILQNFPELTWAIVRKNNYGLILVKKAKIYMVIINNWTEIGELRVG